MSSEKNSASLKTEQSDEVRKIQFKICSENAMLKFGHLLEENGFTKCGIIHVEDGTPRIAYQKMSLTLPLRRD